MDQWSGKDNVRCNVQNLMHGTEVDLSGVVYVVVGNSNWRQRFSARKSVIS